MMSDRGLAVFDLVVGGLGEGDYKTDRVHFRDKAMKEKVRPGLLEFFKKKKIEIRTKDME